MTSIIRPSSHCLWAPPTKSTTKKQRTTKKKETTQPFLSSSEQAIQLAMVYHSKKASFHNKNEKKEDVGSSNRRKVVGLDDFAHRKATGKAIAAFRDRKEQKRLQRAQGLRQYKKVLKAEGYQVETGNLRKKRKKENDNETSTEEKETSVAVEQQQQQNFSSSRKRHHKTVPFVKDIQKAKEAINSTVESALIISFD